MPRPRPPLALAILSLAGLGCCGSGGSTASSRTAPTIAALTFEPRVVYAGSTPTTFTIGMARFDPERDATELLLTARDQAGAIVLDQRYPLAAMVQADDVLTTTASAAFSQLGTFVVTLQVQDRGGRRSNELSTTVTTASYPWLDALPDPVVRRHAAAAVFEGGIFVVGGERRDLGATPGPATTRVTRLDPVSDTWSLPAPLAVARRALVAASSGGVLAAIGGYDAIGSPVGTNEVLTTAAGTWTQGAPMPTARAHAAAAVQGGRIYVAGGTEDGSSALAVVESYDPLTDSWRTEPPLPHPRFEGRAAAFAGRLVVAGGRRSATADEPWLDLFDPITGSWTSPLQIGDSTYLVTLGDHIYSGLGRDLFGNTAPSVDAWRLLSPSLRSNPRGVAAAATDDAIYVFGENTVQSYVRALEIR